MKMGKGNTASLSRKAARSSKKADVTHVNQTYKGQQRRLDNVQKKQDKHKPQKRKEKEEAREEKETARRQLYDVIDAW